MVLVKKVNDSYYMNFSLELTKRYLVGHFYLQSRFDWITNVDYQSYQFRKHWFMFVRCSQKETFFHMIETCRGL